MGHRCKIIVSIAIKNAMGRKNANSPATAGYHETRRQRKNWGSVHHTGYILPSDAEKVKQFLTKFWSRKYCFWTNRPKKGWMVIDKNETA